MVKNIVYLFPGQGSQAVGMGKAYGDISQEARKIFEKANHVLGYDLSQIMWKGPEEKLRETVFTQPALYVTSAAALELLKTRGLEPAYVAGHSLGEYSALYAAGVFGFEEGLRLVSERGKAMQEAGRASKGAMAAIIGLDINKINEICKSVSSLGTCTPANFNSDSQIVISGVLQAVQKAMELSTAAGAMKVVQLNVGGAFHSPLMKSAADKMRSVLSAVNLSSSRVPVITNVDADPTTQAGDFKKKLVEQIDHSVQWHPSLEKLLALGGEIFIEVGSGQVLSRLIKKLDRKKTVLSTDDMPSLEKSLTALAAR